jgi:hypothetical protein
VIARWKGIVEEIHFGGSIMPFAIIENLDLEKPSFGPSKWPRKLKPAKNSKLPKWPENYFEPFGKGGWPPISTWIKTSLAILDDYVQKEYLCFAATLSTCFCWIEGAWAEAVVAVVSFCSPFEQILEKMNFVV